LSSLAQKNIRCLLFDIGDTLWTSHDRATLTALGKQANQRMLALLAQHFSPASLEDPTLGERLRAAFEAEWFRMRRANHLNEPDLSAVGCHAICEVGLPALDAAVGAEIAEALRIRNIDARYLFPDVPVALAELQRRGYILGVVTNRHYGGKIFYEDVRDFGLLDYFTYEHMAISADLVLRKPHPGIFQHALKGLGVTPEETAMVGDSLYADVWGAHQLGMMSIWKPKLSLHDLPEVIDEQSLFERGKAGAQRWNPQFHDFVYPDLIIKHISDLLPVFTGPQG
jgi:HAD superfamily hydrolase (TIGR01662 family)